MPNFLPSLNIFKFSDFDHKIILKLFLSPSEDQRKRLKPLLMCYFIREAKEKQNNTINVG